MSGFLGGLKNRYILKFADKDLEDKFNYEHNRNGIRSNRVSMVLAIILYLSFGFLDVYFLPSVAGKIHIIRLFVTAYFVLILLSGSAQFIVKYFQFVLITVIVAAGGGILLMILIAHVEISNNYYAGLMLVIIWSHSYLGMRFIYATISTWAIIAAYEIVANFFTHTPGVLIISNSFFLISANILGMFASYGLEFYKRTNFIQKVNLEHEYQHKAQELDEARQVQLSMLPPKLPFFPGIDLEIFFATAAEIGGDYYDFIETGNGTIKFAVGDATGHGARTGAMVTAAKILFCNHAENLTLPEFLNKASASISQMRLPRLYMPFAIGEMNTDSLCISGGGIPSGLLFRASTRTLETISLKGLPLGIQNEKFSYQQSEYPLYPGDALVFMTDGFPELFNSSKEMLGIERIGESFLENADKSSSEIKSALIDRINSWTNGFPLQDDLTFLIIKIKQISA